MIYGNSIGTEIDRTFIIQDADGNELVATVTNRQVVFDATPNDIRIGKVAATQNGVTVGEKEIPAYHTLEGYAVISSGKAVRISNLKRCEYTKLQALMCLYNSSMANSVSTEKVAINNSVYAVSSTAEIAKVTTDLNDSAIDFGINNDTGKLLIVRYFMYKEIY